MVATLIPRASIPCTTLASTWKGVSVTVSSGHAPGQSASFWNGKFTAIGSVIPATTIYAGRKPVLITLSRTTRILFTTFETSGTNWISGVITPPGPTVI